MSDRELLELAAKAAGITDIAREDLFNDDGTLYRLGWNPLTDDGAALRLAVKLKLHIGLEDNTVSVWHREEFGNFQTERLMDRGDEAATRRAIVRAAAEIGKGM